MDALDINVANCAHISASIAVRTEDMDSNGCGIRPFGDGYRWK